MLSDTEVHYITGFLYIASGNEDIKIVLGERIYDKASKSKRDVDIAIFTTGTTGILAVEVKDHKHKLATDVIEGLCMKFMDMPSITSRVIVSGSGYTGPARKKAADHNVECLEFVRGALPSFSPIDISELKEITFVQKSWVKLPGIHLIPQTTVNVPSEELLNSKATVTYMGEGQERASFTLQQFLENVRQIALLEWSGSLEDGEYPVNIVLKLDPKHILASGALSIALTEAQITGVICCSPITLPIENACYLADDKGIPFAGAAIVEHQGTLWGLSASPKSHVLRIFHIPEAVRRIRPFKKSL